VVDPINKQLHFIIGIGRSGTTILNKILNAHPFIHSLPEANFLVFFLKDFKDVKVFTSKQIELIFEQIRVFSLSHPLIGYEFDREAVKNKVIEIAASKELSYEQLCKIIYSEFKVVGNDKSSAGILIDKNPSYTIFVNEIAETLPEAKFIFLLRDYRANVLSRKQNVDLNSADVVYNSQRWKLFNRVAMDFFKKNKNKVLILKYEDLVLNSEKEIMFACEFLGIKAEDIKTESDLEQKVNLSHFNIDLKHKVRFAKKYSDLSKPLNSDRLYSWKTELTQEEIKICDVICSDFATGLGYISFLKLSGYDKLKVKFKNIVPIFKAWIDVKKDHLVYQLLPVRFKLKRLKKHYTRINFIKK